MKYTKSSNCPRMKYGPSYDGRNFLTLFLTFRAPLMRYHTASPIWYYVWQQFLSYCLLARFTDSPRASLATWCASSSRSRRRWTYSGAEGAATRSTGSLSHPAEHHEVGSETSCTVLCCSVGHDNIGDLLQGGIKPFNLAIRQTACTFSDTLQTRSSGLGCCALSVVLRNDTPTLRRALQPQLQPGHLVGGRLPPIL